MAGMASGIGIACGLNVYGAVAAIGLAARFGALSLSPALRGLEHPIVIGSALLLLVAEAVADRAPRAQRWWSAAHTVVRPLAAVSLAAIVVVALPVSPPPTLVVATGAAAGVIALLVHASKSGARLLFSVSGEAGRGRWISWAEDLVAVAIAPLAVARPSETLWISAGLLLLLALFGRWLWRAFLLGPRALVARAAGFFGTKGWVEVERMPQWVSRSLRPASLGEARHRATRASLHGAPGRFRNGWLIVGGSGPSFVFRGGSGRVRALPLVEPPCGDVEGDAWVDRLALGHNGARATLFLLKDGPDPAAVQRLLSTSSRYD